MNKDNETTNKNTNAILSYIFIIILWLILSVYIASKKYSMVSSIIQSVLIVLWSYFGHVFAHHISNDFPMNILNPHMLLHHNKSFNIPRFLDLFIEAITNFSAFFILILLQRLFNVHIMSTSIILFGGFLYVAIHIFDYSIFGDHEHHIHHERTMCNYSPRVMDILFNTRCNPNDDYVPMNREVISTLLVFPLVLFLQKKFKLD